MGMDISGYVECRAWHLHEEGENAVWRAAIDLFFLNITRNYDAFGCLFGMRNYANFHPDRKSTRLNSSHLPTSRMPSSA